MTEPGNRLKPARQETDGSEPTATEAGPKLRVAAIASYVMFLFAWFSAPGAWERLASSELSNAIGQLIGTMVALAVVNLVVISVASLWRRNRTSRRRVIISMVTSLAMSALPGVFALRLSTPDSGPPWHYQSAEHRFALTLPSSRWQRVEQATHVADFVRPDLAPILASVLSVERGGREEFEAATLRARDGAQRYNAGYQKPLVRAEETSTDTRYTIAFGSERVEARDRTLLVASCVSWLVRKSVLVTLVFERQAEMVSQAGQTVERREFEQQVTAICRSVR